jgi:hypothetical protein
VYEQFENERWRAEKANDSDSRQDKKDDLRQGGIEKGTGRGRNTG